MPSALVRGRVSKEDHGGKEVKRLRPFIKYYGSKFKLATLYPKPKYDLVIEPFAGSAQYATLYHDREVVICEIDDDIRSCWEWLIQASEYDVKSLPVDMPIGSDIRDHIRVHGAAVLVRTWQRVGINKCFTVSKWNQANSGFWCEPTRNCIASQLKFIRHWKVRSDAFDCVTDTLGPATWFIDPPYQSQSKVYSKVGLEFEYERLADWVTSLRGQKIVCEDSKAKWLPFVKLANNMAGRTSQGGPRTSRDEYVCVIE